MNRLRDIAIPTVATFVAAALRVHHVTRFPLSGDEAFGAALAYNGFDSIIAATTGGDPHPPLFYATLVAWTRIVGNSELSLRYLGVLAGVLLIPLAWWLGRRVVGEVGAIVAMTWLAVHPYQVWYAHEARMYLPAALAATLATASLWRWLEQPVILRLVAYVAAATLAMYTHYYCVLLVAFHSAFVLYTIVAERGGDRLHRDRESPVREWLIGQAGIAIAYVPWIVVARAMIGGYNSLGWNGPLPALGEALVRFTVGHTWEWPGNVAVGGVVAVVGVLGIIAVSGTVGAMIGAEHFPFAQHGRDAGRGHRHAPAILLIGWALAPAAVGLVASSVRPMFTARYLMVSVVAFALLIGAGVAAGWRWWRPLGVLLLVVALAPSLVSLYNLYYQPMYARSGYDNLGSYLLDRGRPGQAIVLAGWTQQDMFWYYYRRRAPDPLPSYFFPRSDPIDPAATSAQLDDLLRQYDGVWYVETDTQRYDPQKVMERHLSAQHYKVLDRWFLVNRLVYYQSAFAPTEHVPIDPARFGDSVELTDGAIGPTSARAGDIVTVNLNWQGLVAIRQNLKASLVLRDPDGHSVASVDREPADGFIPTSTWRHGVLVRDLIGLVVPETALPGEYRLGLKLYDPATGQALRPKTDRRVEGDLLALGTIRVATGTVLSVSKSDPAVPSRFRLGTVELVGYDPPADVEFAPGQAAGARLYVAVNGPAPNTGLMARVVTPDGKLLGTQRVVLAPAWSPASAWQPNRVYAPQVDIAVPARAPTGAVTVWLQSEGDTSGPKVRLFSMRVKSPDRSFTAASPEHSVGARFGQLAVLAGYDGPAAGALVARPGDSIKLRLHWQVIGETDTAYKLFLHLVGPDGQIHGQMDAPPLGGQRPTPGWVTGEWLADPISVTVSPDAPAGDYTLRMGLYEGSTGQRAPVTAGGQGDYIDLFSLQISR